MLDQNLIGSPERVLVCQQRQLGDVLLTTPAIELLHKRFPQADIHMFTEAKCEPMLRGNPHIHALHLIDKKAQRSLFSQIAWYRSVAANRFDLLIDFQQLPRCRMMTRFSGAKTRISFPPPWYRPRLYTHAVPPQPGYAAATKVSLLRPLGIVWNHEPPGLHLTEDERKEGLRLLESLGMSAAHTLVTVDPTHRRASKRWPHYAILLALLAEARPDLRFLLLRGPGEDEELDAMFHGFPYPDRLLKPKEVPPLRISAACIAAAALHIGNCSAPRHIAAALGVASLVISGPSGQEWRYPSPIHRELRGDVPCTPCHATECADPRCLTLVTPEMAMDAALEMLRSPSLIF